MKRLSSSQSKQTTLSSFFSPNKTKINEEEHVSKTISQGEAKSLTKVEKKSPSKVPSKKQKKVSKKKKESDSDYDDGFNSPSIDEENDSEITEDMEEDLVETPTKRRKKVTNPKKTVSSPQPKTKSIKSKTNYTPLELQYISIKKKYPDTILFVECGYKHKFFGEDAEIASKVLNIYSYMSHNFMNASIPTHRLNFHLSRMVNAGYKVGVVSQTETAALKAAGNNKSQPFTRELTSLYTPSTLVGEEIGSIESNFTTSCNYLLCIHEEDLQKQKVRISMVALQLQTGDIVYDCFEDDFDRSEMETRIVQLHPDEVIISKDMSLHSRKLLKNLLEQNSSSRSIRIEDVPSQSFDYDYASRIVEEYYEEKNDMKWKSLPPTIISCIGVLIEYLKDFKLESVFQLIGNFRNFTSTKRMWLPGTTLKNLEILQNSTNKHEKGSLFWVLKHTTTSFGERLLRKWITQPLINEEEINQRIDAVEELAFKMPSSLNPLLKTMENIPDIDRGLCRIHFCKCGPSEFLSILEAFEKIFISLPNHDTIQETVQSTLLSSILLGIPNMLEETRSFLNRICESAAKDGNKKELFKNPTDFPAITKTKKEIQNIFKSLNEHLVQIRKDLRKSSLEYVTKLQTEFLIEIKNTDLKCVPSDWIKINTTKQVSRFHTPFIVDQVKLLAQKREQLDIDCNLAWKDFLSQFSESYVKFRAVVQELSVLDCLHSFAITAKSNNYVKPKIQAGSRKLCIKEGRNPIVEQLNPENYVSNSTEMSEQEEQCMVITGPNMGGKSSYIRQVALIIIMAQIGSFVPASECCISAFDSIYTRMGASDNIQSGQSTFFVELQQTSQMLSHVTSKSLVILDELGRGTSTMDGCSIAYATLWHLLKHVKCFTLFVTHYYNLTSIVREFSSAENYHMSFYSDEEEKENGTPSITFLYQLVKGPSKRSYGLNVARLAGIPSNILTEASKKSAEMEQKIYCNSSLETLMKDSIFKEFVHNYQLLSEECKKRGKQCNIILYLHS